MVSTRSAAAQGGAVGWRWDLAAYFARISDEILSLDDPAAPGTAW